ncbi:MAG TPA: Gldg family protein [Armatimonadota bacterium]|jgi:hypothetical protein
MSEDKQNPQVDKDSRILDPRLVRPDVEVSALVRTIQIGIWAGLVLIAAALAWWGIAGRLTLAPVVLGGFGVLGVLAWIVLNLRALRATAGTRSAKLIFNSLGFIIFVLGILVCVNVIAARHHPRLDLSQGKLYSLAPQSLAVLKSLPQDVDLIAFLPKDSGPASTARDVVQLYSDASPRVRVKWADYTEVGLAKQYNVTFPGTVVVKSGDRTEKVTDVTEQRLTSAIMSVSTTTRTTVYFLVGHGEASSGGENSITTLKSDLGNQQYVVKDLDTAKMAAPAVPQDCGVLVIIGAKVPLAKQEMTAIQQYVDNKGKLLLALAAPPAPDFSEILAPRGIKVLGGVVLDPDSNYLGQAQAPLVVPPAGGSPLLEGVDRLVMPLARGLQVPGAAPTAPGQPPAPPSGPAQGLLNSSDTAWLQTNLQAGVQRPANAPTGPFALAATFDETPAPPPTLPGQPPAAAPEQDATRLVVLGSDVALNDMLVRSFKFNEYLALNSVAWLSKNVRLMTVPPKQEVAHNLLLTSTQKNFIIFIVLFFIPALVIVAGIAVWWTRRR